jgi:hypothetical protein
MQEDIIAACWEVRMGSDPSASPQDTLSACKDLWSGEDKSKRLCELSHMQVFDRPEKVAQCLCADYEPRVLRSLMSSISDAKLEALRIDLGAQDSSGRP